MPFVNFAELKQRVTLEQGALMLGLALTPHGEQFRGVCPQCKSGGPKALVFTPAKGLFYCFPSGKGGDVIALVSHITGCSQTEAATKLEEYIGGTVTTAQPKAGTVTTLPKGDVKGFDFVAYAQKLDPEHEALAELGISPETLRHFQSGYSKAGQNTGRLAIAIHDGHGAIIGFCGRSLKGESPALKFPNGFDPQSIIFNAHRIGKGELYLISDPLQVLTAYEAGIENCVSFLTESISALQLQLLASLMDSAGCSSLEMY